jgi:hypothetical protein
MCSFIGKTSLIIYVNILKLTKLIGKVGVYASLVGSGEVSLKIGIFGPSLLNPDRKSLLPPPHPRDPIDILLYMHKT